MNQKTNIGFGTSGIRGLVSDLSDEVCYGYTQAFLDFLKQTNDLKKGQIAIAGDLRESTERILKVVHSAIKKAGLKTIFCGKIPTPALALYGITKGIPSIMVTGSHIPADRNGIKFNKSEGEILKEDEGIISSLVNIKSVELEVDDLPPINGEARSNYIKRYLDFFPPKLFEGKRIGLYGHSAVGREILEELLYNFSAEVVTIEYSNEFVAIDTEAISVDLKEKGQEWSQKFKLDAIVSTDGDSDRPLLSDEGGNWVVGDILDILTAKFLGAENLVTSVNNSTIVEKSGLFKKIIRTKIGSPYVVAEMKKLSDEGYKKIIGYEANGGFLIGEGFEIGTLPTRDAMIVLLCVLATTKDRAISQVITELPERYIRSDSVKDFPTAEALELLEKTEMSFFENIFGKIKEINTLDGLRMTFENDDIVHLRPSRNAPEFRYYTEAGTKEKAEYLAEHAKKILVDWKNTIILS